MIIWSVPDISKEHTCTVRNESHSSVCSATVWKSHFFFFLQIKMKSRDTRSSHLWNSSLSPPLNDDPLHLPKIPLPVAWLGTLLLDPFNLTTNLQINFMISIKQRKVWGFRREIQVPVTHTGHRSRMWILDIGTQSPYSWSQPYFATTTSKMVYWMVFRAPSNIDSLWFRMAEWHSGKTTPSCILFHVRRENSLWTRHSSLYLENSGHDNY